MAVATVDGTATAGADYTAISGGSFTIPAYSTGFSFTVPITNDTNVESDETFDIVLSSPSGATIGDGTATVTILDDEPIAVITGPGGLGSSATGGEGPTNGNKITFRLSVTPGGMSTPLFFPAAAVTVNYTVSFETGDTASAADFSTLSGSYTFTPSNDPGPRLVNIDLPITDDTLVEGDETFTISITSATGAHVSTTAGSTAGTIADDDANYGTVNVTVDSNNDGTLNSADDGVEETEAAEVLVVPDDSFFTEFDPDYEGSDGPENYLAEQDLIPVQFAFVPVSGLNYDTFKLTLIYDSSIKLWTSTARDESVPSGTEYPLDASGNSSMPSILYVEGMSEATSDIELKLTDAFAIYAPKTAKAKVRAIATDQFRIENPEPVTLNVNSILDNASWTSTVKAQKINELILDRLGKENFKIGSTDAPINMALSPFPEHGILSRGVTAALVDRLIIGKEDPNNASDRVYGFSGWAMGWKIDAEANGKLGFKFNNSLLRFQAWTIVVNEVDTDNVIVGWNTDGTPIVVAGPTNNVAHELWHVEGVKTDLRTAVRAAGLQMVDEDVSSPPSGALIRKIGFKPRFGKLSANLNKASRSAKHDPGSGAPEVTNAIAMEKAKELLFDEIVSKREQISESGKWHEGDLKKIGSTWYTVYRGVPLNP